jgi:oligo-1,6-glucosidase
MHDEVLSGPSAAVVAVPSLTSPTHHTHPIDHDLITVGETPFTHDASELAAYVLPRNRELNMVFHFELMDIDSPPESPLLKKPWTLAELKAVVGRWQRFMRDEGFWNA